MYVTIALRLPPFLLQVNLIMDTMGALALATEDPNPSLLDEKVWCVTWCGL